MSDIYVAGDVHGNYKGLIESLMAAGWNEGTDKLVFVGDVVDRGKENAIARSQPAASKNDANGRCLKT